MNPIWLQTSALVLLSAFLVAKQWERAKAVHRADAMRRAVGGKAFEAKPLLTQMKVTRGKHLSLAQQQLRCSEAHREFATRVGASLRCLPFFTRRDPNAAATLTAEHPAGSV